MFESWEEIVVTPSLLCNAMENSRGEKNIQNVPPFQNDYILRWSFDK